MPRQRFLRPWFHEASGYWCTSVNRKRVYLDKDYRVAARKLREIRYADKRDQQAGREWSEAPFSDLADEFLDDIKARKPAVTHDGYRYRLLRAMRVFGTKLRVCDLTRLHLAKIEQELTAKDQSPTTIKDTIASVQTVFGWAVRHDLLTENPLQGYRKPQARPRNRVIEASELAALLRHSDAKFRRVLLSLRLTGCRPIEIRSLIWEWVDLQNGFWIFPHHKTINRQKHPRPRVVPLPQSIWKLCRWLDRVDHGPTDHVFLNRHGRPYTKDCFCRKMRRIRRRAGIKTKAGERIVLYSARHTFATEAAGKVSDMELAELMGHTTSQTTRRYVHLNASRLRDIQRRAEDRRA